MKLFINLFFLKIASAENLNNTNKDSVSSGGIFMDFAVNATIGAIGFLLFVLVERFINKERTLKK